MHMGTGTWREHVRVHVGKDTRTRTHSPTRSMPVSVPIPRSLYIEVNATEMQITTLRKINWFKTILDVPVRHGTHTRQFDPNVLWTNFFDPSIFHTCDILPQKWTDYKFYPKTTCLYPNILVAHFSQNIYCSSDNIIVSDYMKSRSWCRRRKAHNWNWEPLGSGEGDWGGKGKGRGQFKSNLGPEWTGVAPHAKEGVQVSKRDSGAGKGSPGKGDYQGDSSRGLCHALSYIVNPVYIVLLCVCWLIKELCLGYK